MTDARGFRLAMVIMALAWGAIFVSLIYVTVIQGAFTDLDKLWSLIASASAVLGAVLTRGFHLVGVILYSVAALSLIVQPYLIRATGPMPVGWPYILGLLLFAGLVWSQWEGFRRPNA